MSLTTFNKIDQGLSRVRYQHNWSIYPETESVVMLYHTILSVDEILFEPV